MYWSIVNWSLLYASHFQKMLVKMNNSTILIICKIITAHSFKLGHHRKLLNFKHHNKIESAHSYTAKLYENTKRCYKNLTIMNATTKRVKIRIKAFISNVKTYISVTTYLA